MSLEMQQLKTIIEAALMAYGQPLSIDRISNLFEEHEQIARQDIREALQLLQEEAADRGIELVEVGSGFRYQAKKDFAPWVARLWEEKPPRYSRALLETLVLVAYRQPITRGEVEDIRGVSVSSHIIKTLQERDWVRVVGHKDVPGKPALYATTKAFLDYFNLKSLEELPSLAEVRDLDKISAELGLAPEAQQGDAESADVESDAEQTPTPAVTAESEQPAEAELEQAQIEAQAETLGDIIVATEAEQEQEVEATLDHEVSAVTVAQEAITDDSDSVENESAAADEHLSSSDLMERHEVNGVAEEVSASATTDDDSDGDNSLDEAVAIEITAETTSETAEYAFSSEDYNNEDAIHYSQIDSQEDSNVDALSFEVLYETSGSSEEEMSDAEPVTSSSLSDSEETLVQDADSNAIQDANQDTDEIDASITVDEEKRGEHTSAYTDEDSSYSDAEDELDAKRLTAAE